MTEEGYQKELERLEHGNISERALAVALRYGQIDGDHHKAWVIDQMVRLLAGAAYGPLVKAYEQGGEYEWSEGIAP
jgi:phosphatidylserine/phosphatidylglycerophosphate/cardiolipin synthase-like enzyme